MKLALAGGAVVALGCVLAATIWWPEGPQQMRAGESPAAHDRRVGKLDAAAAGAGAKARPSEAPPAAGSRSAQGRPGAGVRRQTPSGGIPVDAIGTPGGTRPATKARPARRRATSAGAAGAPRVTRQMAFKALLYVGIDPEAEKTWMQAINDPNLPEGVRSDLIEDLNDEGYLDPGGSHITKADLPLIVARLEIIERLAPYAMDRCNADAFEEAYKDLLNMYVRLLAAGGK